jgi:opacity protein-like surface antigen
MRLFVTLALTLSSASAFAQQPPALREHRFTLGGGIAWSGSYDIGDATAQLRGNGPGPSASPVTLFTSDSHVTSAASPELRIGFAMTRRIALEFGMSVTQPHIAVAIAGDTEAPSQVLPGEKLEQYLFEGGATWQPPVRMGTKLAPFIGGGVTFLRQLHEDRTLAETGQVYHAGGGARYFLRGGHGITRAVGLRGDARVNFRRHGIDFHNTMRTYSTLTLSVFVGL